MKETRGLLEDTEMTDREALLNGCHLKVLFCLKWELNRIHMLGAVYTKQKTIQQCVQASFGVSKSLIAMYLRGSRGST